MAEGIACRLELPFPLLGTGGGIETEHVESALLITATGRDVGAPAGPHLDAASGEQIAPASVVVQFAEVGPIPNDEKLRLDMNLVGGSGQLVVFSGGTRREGLWSKSAPRSSTRWLDEHGDRLTIPPGPVWVEVLPLGSPLSWR